MGRVVVFAVFALLVVFANAVPLKKKDVKDVPLLQPHVRPTRADTYLCHGKKMEGNSRNIVGFRPKGDMNIAHHILVYGCTEPGSHESKWDCSEMASDGQSEFTKASVCGAGARIVYAWAMDAPSLKLPEGVGFEVGQSTDVKYLVVQVHYKDVTKFVNDAEATDNSGVILEVTKKRMPRPAGVYLLGTGGLLPAGTSVHMEAACKMNYKTTIQPFAFRTHAHTHGRVVSGYRIRNEEWTEIGQKDPRKPEMFYNVTNPGMNVTDGDILAARCTMINDDNQDVAVGSTQRDEMCNFYVMYYTERQPIIQKYYCFSSGPPNYYWANSTIAPEMNVLGAPRNVSVIPGTNEDIKDTTKAGRKIEEMLNTQMAFDPRPRDVEEYELLEWLNQNGVRV